MSAVLHEDKRLDDLIDDCAELRLTRGQPLLDEGGLVANKPDIEH